MTFSCKLDMCTLVQICIFGFDQLTIDDKSKNFVLLLLGFRAQLFENVI